MVETTYFEYRAMNALSRARGFKSGHARLAHVHVHVDVGMLPTLGTEPAVCGARCDVMMLRNINGMATPYDQRTPARSVIKPSVGVANKKMMRPHCAIAATLMSVGRACYIVWMLASKTLDLFKPVQTSRWPASRCDAR